MKVWESPSGSQKLGILGEATCLLERWPQVSVTKAILVLFLTLLSLGLSFTELCRVHGYWRRRHRLCSLQRLSEAKQQSMGYRARQA